jgi:sugar-phosphatase
MIKAVIFDMDGLLIDSEPLWEEAEIKTFREVGVPLTKKKSIETMGLRVDEVVEHWF